MLRNLSEYKPRAQYELRIRARACGHRGCPVSLLTFLDIPVERKYNGFINSEYFTKDSNDSHYQTEGEFYVMSEQLLEIKGLHAGVEGKEILKGLDLSLGRGEVHVILGPNGSGKSTLMNVIMGHPNYEVTDGEIRMEGEECILNLSTPYHFLRGVRIYLSTWHHTTILRR